MKLKLVAEILIDDKRKAKLDDDYSNISYYFMQGIERDDTEIKVISLTTNII